MCNRGSPRFRSGLFVDARGTIGTARGLTAVGLHETSSSSGPPVPRSRRCFLRAARMAKRRKHRASEAQEGRSERPATGHGRPRAVYHARSPSLTRLGFLSPGVEKQAARTFRPGPPRFPVVSITPAAAGRAGRSPNRDHSQQGTSRITVLGTQRVTV